MRDLMIIPIIHTATDLGDLREPIERVKLGRIDEQAARAARSTVDQFWDGLKQGLENWDYDFQRLSVYQDALPVGPIEADGIEQKIVDDLAGKGSANHQLIAWLIQQGAVLVGTEEPTLLLKEYELVKQFLDLRLGDDSSIDAEEVEIARKQGEILVQRDQFIAKRIDETLSAEGAGLIFLGMLHQLENRLPDDIDVSFPFGRPVKHRSDTLPNSE
jgi:hypothetical protein